MTDRYRERDFEHAAAEQLDAYGLDPDSFRAMYGIFRLGSRMFNDLESTIHRPAGWSLAGFRVMFLLWVSGDLESKKIARLAGLSRAAISSAVNTLERDGLVQRSRESSDRRLVTVRLTADGTRRIVEAYRQQNDREKLLFRNLSADELATLTDLMRRVSNTRPPESELS